MLSVGPPALVVPYIADGNIPDGVTQAKGERGKTQAFGDVEDREIVEDEVIQQLRQGARPQLEGASWAQKRLKERQLRGVSASALGNLLIGKDEGESYLGCDRFERLR